MKKILLLFFCISMLCSANAQDGMPKYYDVLKKYFTTYDDIEDYKNYTSFAKKKDGWYVQKINRIEKDKLLEENLFWDLISKKYQIIPEYGRFEEENKDWEKRVEHYLQNAWYNYERIKYFGYSTWAKDMIAEYGNAENLSDTIYEGLSRAYNINAINYLWYQQGGAVNKKDTMQIPLQRTQIPTKERIIKVEENIIKSIEAIKKIKNKNYETVVGNVSLKIFNEQMNGYTQMYMVGNDEKANNFLNNISLDNRYILQAKNYLNSCNKNAVLFTYGDNDTYQLWYVQKKLNYRTDVSVINTSLLGFAAYINQLKLRKVIKINAPLDFISNEESDVSYANPDPTVKPEVAYSLKTFLDNIYKKKSIRSVYDNRNTAFIKPTYAEKIIRLQKANTTITIKLNNYLYLNDLMVMDIIESNLADREIYFTSNYDSYFKKDLMQEGICFKLNFIKNTLAKKSEIAALEKFIQEKYISITSDYSSTPNFILTDGDNTFVSMYTTILEYYDSKNDKINFNKWAEKFITKISNFSLQQTPSLSIAAEMIVKCNNNKVALKIIELSAEHTFYAYQNPSYLTFFYSKNNCKMKMLRLQALLESAKQKSSYLNDLILKLN